MITSSSIPYISKALNEPQNISEADAESIDALIQAYPYFMPARYMDAAKKHKGSPYNEELMAQMQLYSGNWILYSDFLNEVVDGADVEMASQEALTSTTEQTVVDNVPEPITEETTQTVEEAPVTEAVETKNEPTIISSENDNDTDDADDFNPVNTDFNTGDKPYVRKEKRKDRKPIVEERMMTDNEDDEALILPIYTDDYFLHQGVNVSNKIPEDFESAEGAIESESNEDDEEKALMVVMSFAEWLNFFKTKKQAEEEEEEGQKALKTMWQKEKLAAALEEEDEEIPENVFEMAVNSISKEDGLISESLANIHIKQGRYDKAIDMYRKLSLRNPQKKAYFARKIEYLIKEQEQ
ncbi:MAG: tetratricopeptide repeat protein [Flavipsychrobacter sp.]